MTRIRQNQLQQLRQIRAATSGHSQLGKAAFPLRTLIQVTNGDCPADACRRTSTRRLASATYDSVWSKGFAMLSRPPRGKSTVILTGHH